MPNWHNKYPRWREVTLKGKFSNILPSSLWPASMQEDDNETETDNDSETEGEKCIRGMIKLYKLSYFRVEIGTL